MSISVQSLINSTADIYRLKLISGKEGALRPVSWMYYTEDVSTLNFLRGGELVITTGLELRHEDGSEGKSYIINYLSKLIESLTQQNAAGLIINVGKYIDEVPVEITELCLRLQFPLLTMPWEIHIIDIMQDYGNRIVNDRQKSQSLEMTLFNALFNLEQFNIFQLENTPFATAKIFSVVLVEFPEVLSQKDEESFLRYMDYSLNIKTGIQPSEYVYFPYKNKIVYIFHSDAHEYVYKIEKAVRKDKNFDGMKISISGICESPRDLAAEFHHAELAFKLCKQGELFSDYETLGIFKLLGEVHDKRILQRFYDEMLGPLSSYGKDKLDDYLNTLKLYLESSGKVTKTAEENFTHRNTVNYRIKKICDTLNIDLSDGYTRYMIQTAIYIREFLKNTED